MPPFGGGSPSPEPSQPGGEPRLRLFLLCAKSSYPCAQGGSASCPSCPCPCPAPQGLSRDNATPQAVPKPCPGTIPHPFPGASRVPGCAGVSGLVPSASRMDLSLFSLSAKEGNAISASLQGSRDGDSSARPPLGALITPGKVENQKPQQEQSPNLAGLTRLSKEPGNLGGRGRRLWETPQAAPEGEGEWSSPSFAACQNSKAILKA